MSEVTKITFYGKDFSYLKEAEYSLDRSKTKLRVDEEPKYLNLLKAFCRDYKYEKVRLLFPKNAELEDAERFNKYVGVFRDKKFPYTKELESGEKIEETYDVTLEISCRFDTHKNAYFLAAMLLCLDPEKLKFIIDPKVNITFHHVMDIFLLFMYKKQLADAAKKGIFRKYQRFENNDSRPHGTIDIARHIRENMGLKSGNIAYHYRELTANNPVNRLILAAYRRLCEKFPTICEEHINSEESVYSTLKMLQTELGYSKTNVRNIVKENLRPVTHPYFSEYEALRKTCLKILRDENVSIFDADCSEETDAIYFDITVLWEKYLEAQFNKLLSVEFKELSVSPQKSDIFLLNPKGGDGINKEATPDFLFKKGNKNIAVLDAKFKFKWKERKKKYLTADIDECIRNMAVFLTRRTGVIYPCNSGDSEREPKEFNIVGKKTRGQEVYKQKNHELFFDVVEVAVPETDGELFDAWSEKLDKSVRDTLRKYLNLIKISEN